MKNSRNVSSGQAPNEILYGMKLNNGIAIDDNVELSDLENKREIARKEAADAIAWANQKMKEYYDARHHSIMFSQEDLVHIELQHQIGKPGYIIAGIYRKLNQQYIDPHLVK